MENDLSELNSFILHEEKEFIPPLRSRAGSFSTSETISAVQARKTQAAALSAHPALMRKGKKSLASQ